MTNWYKKAQQSNKDWKPFLKELYLKKENLRKKAEKKGAVLGHFLDGWSPMNSCYCRKCGAYAKINGFYSTDEKETFYGAAFMNKCHVNFNNAPEFNKYKNPNPKNAIL